MLTTLVLSALLASTLGLLLGTAIDASAFGPLLGLLLAAATMLGCARPCAAGGAGRTGSGAGG
ncbi:hypothetical protein [Streptomyces hygroscopicus]|uniref:hypothetical protein n=1 Tax=Streptomyces hygroscopicus TaxID=1912 RepID=UPI0033D25CAE